MNDCYRALGIIGICAVMDDDSRWMAHALALAQAAETEGEVPVGAVVVLGNELMGEGWNRPIATHDPTAHAEIIALRAAGNRLGNYRLLETTLYVSLEPCLMCVGAMIHARVKRLVFGAYDFKSGAAGSVFSVLESGQVNHQIEVLGRVQETMCIDIMQAFFRARR